MRMLYGVFAFLSGFLTSCAVVTPVDVKPFSQPAMHGTNDSSTLLKKKVLILDFLNHSSFSGREVRRQVAIDIESAVLRMPDLIPISEDVLDGHEDFAADENEYNYR